MTEDDELRELQEKVQRDDILTLSVKRVVGPAPYVGRPFCYVWRVAVDRHKRWVADDADRRWL